MKRYPKYKDSGVEWIGEIPENWDTIKLKYSEEVIMGQSPSSDDYNDLEIGLPFLQGNADFTSLYPKPRIWCDTANKIAKENDILLSVRAPIGAVNIADQMYGIGRGLCAIRSEKSLKNLLFYFSLSIHDELNKIGTGSTYTAVSIDDIKNVFIPSIPPIEQQSIANYLDHKTQHIDTLIDKKQKQIELLKEQRTAIINHAVTKGLNPDVKMKDSGIEWMGEIPAHWELKKLKCVAKSVMTGSTPPTNQEEYFNDGIFNWFSPGDFGEDIKLVNAKRKISEIALNDGKARFFDKHSVLLIGIGATLGKIGIIEDSGSSNQQINAITFIDEFNPYYGAYYLDSISDIIVSLSNFATLPIFNQTQTKDILMLVPPIDEQNEINKYIFEVDDQTKTSIRKTNSQIELLKEYRTTLVSDAVTGKIDVRNEVPA